MALITRVLDLVAALILEVTVIYVDSTFDDVLTSDARFLAFTSASCFAIWRALGVWQLVAAPCRSLVRKAKRKLDLTLVGEIVFSTFCVREDG